MSATNEDHPANEETNEQQENQQDQQQDQQEHNTGENIQNTEAHESETQQSETQQGEAQQEDARGEQAEESQADVARAENEPASEGRPEETAAPEDLFDLMGDAGKEHKKKKPEPAKQATGNAAGSAAAKKPEPKVFPSGSTVVYSGHKIELEEEMTGEQLIKFLEDDFPELTGDTTEFTHDEARGRIVPTRKALKKGASRTEGGATSTRPASTGTDGGAAEPPSLTVHAWPRERPLPPVHRVLAYDGVYEVRDTALGTFTARVPAAVMMHEAADLKVPKAPVSLLEDTVRVFKERPDREVLLTIMYDHRDGRHHLAWVEQTATATSIDYDPAPESEHLTVYCEIHSHNVISAFFSATDDGSEARSTGLYGVIGRVDLDRPHAAFRYSCGVHFRPICAASLFDHPARVRELVAECPA